MYNGIAAVDGKLQQFFCANFYAIFENFFCNRLQEQEF